MQARATCPGSGVGHQTGLAWNQANKTHQFRLLGATALHTSLHVDYMPVPDSSPNLRPVFQDGALTLAGNETQPHGNMQRAAFCVSYGVKAGFSVHVSYAEDFTTATPFSERETKATESISIGSTRGDIWTWISLIWCTLAQIIETSSAQYSFGHMEGAFDHWLLLPLVAGQLLQVNLSSKMYLVNHKLSRLYGDYGFPGSPNGYPCLGYPLWQAFKSTKSDLLLKQWPCSPGPRQLGPSHLQWLFWPLSQEVPKRHSNLPCWASYMHTHTFYATLRNADLQLKRKKHYPVHYELFPIWAQRHPAQGDLLTSVQENKSQSWFSTSS